MIDELIISPFERRIVGSHGAVVLRRNLAHADRSVAAINHRQHPAWSQMANEVVTERPNVQ